MDLDYSSFFGFFLIIHYCCLNFVWYSFFPIPWTLARFLFDRLDFRFNSWLYIWLWVSHGRTILHATATPCDLFVKLSWYCILRCYGYYHHNVFFALTATSLFRRQLHRRAYLSCSSYWWQIYTNITWIMFGKTTI